MHSAVAAAALIGPISVRETASAITAIIAA
jgi:hypothetical protein